MIYWYFIVFLKLQLQEQSQELDTLGEDNIKLLFL